MACQVKYDATCKYHRYNEFGVQRQGGMPNDRVVSRRFRWVDHSNPNIFGHRPAYRRTVLALDRITYDGEVSSTGIRAFGIDNGARVIKLYDWYPILSQKTYHTVNCLLCSLSSSSSTRSLILIIIIIKIIIIKIIIIIIIIIFIRIKYKYNRIVLKNIFFSLNYYLCNHCYHYTFFNIYFIAKFFSETGFQNSFQIFVCKVSEVYNKQREIAINSQRDNKSK